MSADWGRLIRLHELARGVVTLRLEPDAAQRARIAHDLGLESLPALVAEVTIRPWLDGAEIAGRFKATVEQLCSVTLEAFEQPVAGDIEVRAAPAGSPNAPGESVHELELELDAPDPPDVLESDAIDVSAYVVEHLALEIDPFPRKPGAEFDYQPPAQEESPFAVLKNLKPPKP
ncbi:MAG TPA: DUF177 domain-containing protein [Phenylobacterium sp.]|uniref:YceD family protein n=1 Tax=Phenylobacterium sp. TaxID=1871053 RepID=UPI002B487602|nr:DUF177 domain-containing protein [Phenylobacterium sp.]HKR90165.1 DUF177 domain-containing protein [Phenylobacterium sp.]